MSIITKATQLLQERGFKEQLALLNKQRKLRDQSVNSTATGFEKPDERMDPKRRRELTNRRG